MSEKDWALIRALGTIVEELRRIRRAVEPERVVFSDLDAQRAKTARRRKAVNLTKEQKAIAGMIRERVRS